MKTPDLTQLRIERTGTILSDDVSIGAHLVDGSRPRDYLGAEILGYLDVRHGDRPRAEAAMSLIEQAFAALAKACVDEPPRTPATSPAATALRLARTALINADQQCRWHGKDFEKLGTQWDEPRCDSCKQPWRVERALAAITAALDEQSAKDNG